MPGTPQPQQRSGLPFIAVKLMLAVSIGLGLLGCSGATQSKFSTVETTVAGVGAEYVAMVVGGNLQFVKARIMWSAYTGVDESRTQTAHEREALAFRAHLTKHPEDSLLNYAVTLSRIDESENTAEVSFEERRNDKRRPRKFSVELSWTGSGWLISDDTLFGEGQLIAKIVGEPTV